MGIRPTFRASYAPYNSKIIDIYFLNSSAITLLYKIIYLYLVLIINFTLQIYDFIFNQQ